MDEVCCAMDRNRVAVWLVILIVYLLGFNGQWRVESDSALYLSLGRNLAEGLGYTYQGMPHQLVHPGLPHVLAVCFALFGESRGMVMANVLMLGSGLAALWCCYRWVTMAVDRGVAMCVVAGLAGTFLFHRYCYQIMTDMPFVLGAAATLAGYESLVVQKRWRHWESLLLPLGVWVMVMTRPVAWALVPAVGVGVIYHLILMVVKRQSLAAAWTAAVVLGGAGGYLWLKGTAGLTGGGNYEAFVVGQATQGGGAYWQIVWGNFGQLFQEIFSEAILGFEAYFWGNIVVAVGLLGCVAATIRHRPIWAAWVAGTLAMMILVLPVDRYLLPIMPIFVVSWVMGLREVSRWAARREVAGRWPGRWGRVAVAGLLGLGLVVNVPKVIGHIVEQNRRPFIEAYKGGRSLPIVMAARVVAEHVPADGVVLSPYKTDRIISFYTRRKALGTVSMTTLPAGVEKFYVVLDETDAGQRRFLEERGLRLGQQLAEIPGRPGRKGWALMEGRTPQE